jgi:hypothetical protein
MMAFIPPVAPSSNAVERSGPSHHTLGLGTLAAIFFEDQAGRRVSTATWNPTRQRLKPDKDKSLSGTAEAVPYKEKHVPT